MNPDHLIEQAERLLASPERGAPRQADKRRAVSAAYYALFHRVLSAVADEFMGAANRRNPRYRLAYRSISHARVSLLCRELNKPTPGAQWRAYWPPSGFDPALREFAVLFVNLMEARHRADYDPSLRLLTSEALDLVQDARQALARFEASSPTDRHRFVSLLAFEPRPN